MMSTHLILVTEKDEPVGTMEKMEAHQRGILHRAFSVIIFNSAGKMLLQQRALKKYHGGGLWTNACCSHPFPDEEVKAAAHRRLMEEMGFKTPIEKIFEFTYRAHVENNLIEHEYDHVFAGEYDGPVEVNRNEVSDFCYKEVHSIKEAIKEKPEKFTTWFRIAFPAIESWWEKKYGTMTRTSGSKI
jgi:isopentenyl-diphosphate delta-isomerase